LIDYAAAADNEKVEANSHEALDVPQLAIRVDNLLLRFEALIAPSAGHGLQTHVGRNSKMDKKIVSNLTLFDARRLMNYSQC
jgi:hypothetical protein